MVDSEFDIRTNLVSQGKAVLDSNNQDQNDQRTMTSNPGLRIQVRGTDVGNKTANNFFTPRKKMNDN